MRLYLQWARDTALDWEPVDVTSNTVIRRLPKRGVPTSASTVDAQPGWLNAVNCQGVVFSGYDHVAIEYLPGDILVITGWEDDPEDYPDDIRWADQIRFEPLGPDPALGGRLNTRQTLQRWCTPKAAQQFPNSPVHPWEEFSPPPAALTFHGIWMPQALFEAHAQALTPHGWMEWGNGA